MKVLKKLPVWVLAAVLALVAMPAAAAILELSSGSSVLVRLAAAALLTLHVAGGTIGITSGMTALLAPKATSVHRSAGAIFFVSMLFMAGIGATVSPFLPRPEWGSSVMGAFTFYLVATSWVTVRREAGKTGRAELALVLLAAGIAMYGVIVALTLADHSPHASGGESPNAALVGAGLAALAAIGDLRVIVRGGISGTRRIARHLWRMCLALLIASGSLFLGQQQLFPQALRGSFVLAVPELLVLAVMLFWVIRLRIRRRPPRLALATAR